MSNKNKSKERIGAISYNKMGSQMKVIEYNDCSDILVEFDSSKPIHTSWNDFIKGKVKNPYYKSVQGIGYVGEGKYKTNINGKNTPQYIIWTHMLKRCYNIKYQQTRPTYKGCTVDKGWHNFQNFAEWYDENYYEIANERMCLDKDILIKGNKVYSPDTCIFVPEFINNLFVKSNARRGQYPIGLTLVKDRNSPFQVRCRDTKNKNINIGYFDNPNDAFKAYKSFKENVIKETAKEYRNQIPETLYNAMINYQVDISD